MTFPTRITSAVASTVRTLQAGAERLRAARAARVTPTAEETRTALEIQRRAYESARVIAGDGGVHGIDAQLARIRALDAGQPRKSYTILGGGMSGLIAAYELERLGHSVRILEGSGRLGGRIYTARFPDGSFHELGAMRIPASHDYSRHYVDELGLSLRKFVSSHENEDAFFDIAGVRTPIRDARQTLLPKFHLSQEELGAKYPVELFPKAMDELLGTLTPAERESLLGAHLASDRLRELDHVTIGDFLRGRYGEDAVQLIGRTTGLREYFDKSVAGALRERLLGLGQGLEEIEGGMDRLPLGLAERIKGPIELNTRLLGMRELPDGKWQLTLSRNGGKPEVEVVEHPLNTLPFSVLRDLDTPTFSAGKQHAIDQMPYESSTKVILDVKQRFWEDQGLFGGSSHSDRGTAATYYPSDNAVVRDPAVSQGPGAMLGSYTWGDEARALGALSPAEREQAVAQTVGRIHPELTEPGMVKGSQSMFWDEYPFAKGAFAVGDTGSFELFADAIRPEGTMHFAGEHASRVPGWIQGAAVSSLRAVEEMVAGDRPEVVKALQQIAKEV